MNGPFDAVLPIIRYFPHDISFFELVNAEAHGLPRTDEGMKDDHRYDTYATFNQALFIFKPPGRQWFKSRNLRAYGELGGVCIESESASLSMYDAE